MAAVSICSTQSENSIGGTTAATRNILAVDDFGIIVDADGTTPIGNVIRGNYVGTDVTGTQAAAAATAASI